MSVRFCRGPGCVRRAVAMIVLAAVAGDALGASAEQRNLEELRNTVVNLLQGLVDRGVLTREQASGMVQAAQQKATADAEASARAAAEQEKADEEGGAVRVPYVPEIVKDEIRKQVVAELAPQVTQQVVEQAQSEQWGVPAALPDWIRRVRLSGDVRLRGQGDTYANDNAQFAYLDFLTVNDRGGITRAGAAALLNTTEERQRLRARVRLGLEAELGWGWQLATRLTTGNLRDPVSTNQTLGNTGARYQTDFDLAYLKWYGNSATGKHVLNLWGGRIPNPWMGSDMLWDADLNFEGIAANYRLGLSRDNYYSRFAFVTLGAFPMQEIELSSHDKWLFGGQLGFEWKFDGGSRLRFGAGYYDYENIVGRRNAAQSTLLDYTAPQFLQKGNSLFDIRADNDNSTNLFALAADYKLANATVSLDYKVSPLYRIALLGDYVRNVGFDRAETSARLGFAAPKNDTGYLAEINFGASDMARHSAWRAFVGYRYVESDAVLDAFTDSDFHLGGTDAKGYYIGGDYAVTPKVVARLRYLSANEIDGPPLGIDVLQLDLSAQF